MNTGIEEGVEVRTRKDSGGGLRSGAKTVSNQEALIMEQHAKEWGEKLWAKG